MAGGTLSMSNPAWYRSMSMGVDDACLATFGAADPAIAYVPRRAAYAVMLRGDAFAAVRGGAGWFLPGGGCAADETFERALQREIREELGHDVASIDAIGRAVQYFHAAADGVHYRMAAALFAVELGGRVGGEPEHALQWLPLAERESLQFHACHAWAVGLRPGPRQ